MTMTEGTVAEWMIPDGGEVKQGEIVYRLETEKINFEVEAEAGRAPCASSCPKAQLAPGSIVGYILAAGEAMPAGVAGMAGCRRGAAPARPRRRDRATPRVSLEGGRVPASPIARRLAKEAGLALGASRQRPRRTRHRAGRAGGEATPGASRYRSPPVSRRDASNAVRLAAGAPAGGAAGR